MYRIALLIFLAIVPCLAQQPKFELADVHVSPTAKGFAQNFGGVLREGKYINRDATMLQLIEAAYSSSEDSISGGPGWLNSDLFDVIAKVPPGTTQAAAKLMLRSLLAERFGLVIHEGTHAVPRYVLTVAKSGSKLKRASDTGSSGCEQVQQGGSSRGGPIDLASLPTTKVICRNLTAAGIADNLSEMANAFLEHQVVDSSMLEGSWDFSLEWTPRPAPVAKDAGGISIFDALERQLGLKLDLQKIPEPALVIEKVNPKPTENAVGVANALSLATARFEVASIKPANPNKEPFDGLVFSGGSQVQAGGTLHTLIAFALEIRPNVAADLLIGLPKFADRQRWDITAKVPTTGEGAPQVVRGRVQPPTLSIELEMLRSLLIDEFDLKIHTENREVTVYALTVKARKPKLNRADEAERSGCRFDPSVPRFVPSIGAMIVCKNTTMAELAEDLQRRADDSIDHPVVDATGLVGGWDFAMGWSLRSMVQSAQASNLDPSSNAVSEAAPANSVTVFEAVERELGLQLVKQRRSVPVIVIDHVNEKPKE